MKRELPNIAQHYFKRYKNYQKSYPRQWEINPACRAIIVIPAYAEDPHLSLDSLARCELSKPKEIMVLWLINQAQGESHLEFHQAQAKALKGLELPNGLILKTMACLDLNPKEAGVGLARKIGMDQALEAFAEQNYDGMIFCLDADCEVAPNYLELCLDLAEGKWQGLSIYFEHRLNELDSAQKEAIINYELWLRYYRLALKWTNYPWHFHTVGSSMAVRASTYAKIGGMNRRKAGEDFYFLHKLMPQGNYAEISATTVYPSARVSKRVPFGTGRAIWEQEQGRKDFIITYNHLIFKQLKDINESATLGKEMLFKNQYFADLLQRHPSYAHSFEALERRSTKGNFLTNFWQWWDGFKVLRFVHDAQAQLQDEPIENSCKMLFGTKGQGEELLMELRALDKKAGVRYF